MENVIYEHLNWFTDFDPKVSFPIKIWEGKNKPYGGLWGSRVDATKGWRYYLNEIEKDNITETCTSFRFKLKPNAILRIITSYKDYLELPKMYDPDTGEECVDYVQCFNDGIDAIELRSLGDEYEEYYDEETIEEFDEVFCSHWQCDSIVVINPDAYEIIE